MTAPGQQGSTPPAGTVTVVLPAGVDDPRRPSGGNRYDRRVCDELRRLGWRVRERTVPGSWPYPDDDARAGLAAALSDPAGTVLVDGLVAVGAAEVVARCARTRPVAVLAHMAFGSSDPALRTGERLLLSQVALVVTTSHWLAEHLRCSYALPGPVEVAPPGVDRADAPATPTAGGTRLLCVAAVTRAKGYDVLMAALNLVADRAWRCTCAGALDVEPDFAARIRADARRLGADRVRFTGPLSAAEVSAAYAGADLVVLPSRAESWGMVVTEALAHKVPVLASDVGGVPEALDSAGAAEGLGGSRPGLLVPAGDSDALADALARWLTDPALRSRLRAAARAAAPGLSGWDRTARQVAAALTRAARRHASAAGVCP